MKHWPRQFSFWLALFAAAALVAELAWLEVERRRAGRLTLQWREQLRQSEALAGASPARTPGNEQAMAEAVARLRREVAALRAELFPATADPAVEAGLDGRIDAYFDVAALMIRLRSAAAAAGVVLQPDEHFGFGAYAQEAPPVASMARVQQQCRVGETLLGCLFSGRPRELLAVRREPVDPGPAAVDRQQRDYFVLERGLSLREEEGTETMAFRVEFSGETSALRGFLEALAHGAEVLVVRSIEVAPAGGGAPEKSGDKGNMSGPTTRPILSRFAVTVEAVRAASTFAPRTP